MILNHHHQNHLLIQNIDMDSIQPSKVVESKLSISSSWLVRRSDASDATTSCVSNTEFGKCALPTQSQTLPIVLGVTIPLLGAICLLVYLHFRHLKKLKMEELAGKDIDVDMDDYDTSMNHNPLVPNPQPNEKFNQYPDQHSIRRGSMETANSINPRNPFYARAPYMLHPELNTSQHSLEEYSRSLHSMMDSNVYPSNASIYSTNIGGISRPNSPKFPPLRIDSPGPMNTNLGISPPQPRRSVSSQDSYLSSDRTEKGASTISPPSTVAYSPDTNTHPMDRNSDIKIHRQQNGLEDQIAAALPVPPQRAYHRESTLSINSQQQDLSRDSIRYSQDFKTRILSHSEIPPIPFDQSKDFSFEPKDGKVDQSDQPKAELDRSVTKQFERVKSIYREYLPDSPEPSPDVKPIEDNSHIPDINEHSNHLGQYPQHGQLDEIKSDNPFTHNQHAQENKQYLENHPEYPESQHNQPAYPDQQAEYPAHHGQMYQQADYPSNQQAYPQQSYDYPNQYDQYSYPEQQYTHPAYSQQGSSPISPYENPSGTSTPNFHRPFAPSPEPSRAVTPLSDLAQLPVPHNLDENDSPLAYAPQRRHNKGGAASPIPAFNPLNNWNGEDAGTLPSPHELRKSVALMTFAPPKKYVGAGSASSSRAGSMTSASSPNGQWIGPSPKARPSSQLVPDAKDTQMLRPQMNMR